MAGLWLWSMPFEPAHHRGDAGQSDEEGLDEANVADQLGFSPLSFASYEIMEQPSVDAHHTGNGDICRARRAVRGQQDLLDPELEEANPRA